MSKFPPELIEAASAVTWDRFIADKNPNNTWMARSRLCRITGADDINTRTHRKWVTAILENDCHVRRSISAMLDRDADVGELIGKTQQTIPLIVEFLREWMQKNKR